MGFDASLFWSALTSRDYLHGAFIALSLAVLAQATGIALGLGLGLMRRSDSPFGRRIASAYVWFFRALPTLLVLLLVWNALPQVIPILRDEWYSPFIAAYFALALHEGALMCEIVRSGLISIDPGQRLAARSLGFNPYQAFRHILLPQITRVIIPPTGNNFISMIKLTTLASVISLTELLTTADRHVSTTFRYAEYYAAAAVYYLVIVSVFMAAQAQLERLFRWKATSRSLAAWASDLVSLKQTTEDRGVI